MDSATGLLYVGNGQYYDPVTGRFLTRDAKPNNSNPYVPWDPTGALLGPLGLWRWCIGAGRNVRKERSCEHVIRKTILSGVLL